MEIFKYITKLLKSNKVRHIKKDEIDLASRYVSKYKFDNKLDPKEEILSKYGYSGDLLDLFTKNKGSIVHKWHHYIPIYEKYFSRFRNTDFRFLEIGVDQGGSLQMWRNYFGKNAKIFGIDINQSCIKFDGLAGNVRIGSQTDPVFIGKVIDEMGGVDVVLDDGSHQMEHIRKTINYLFPRLNYGGLYFIEDLHTAYWNHWGGGIDKEDNIFNLVRDICDDMHRWYHGKELKCQPWTEDCSSLHIHDSIIVLEKNKVYSPKHSQIGEGIIYS